MKVNHRQIRTLLVMLTFCLIAAGGCHKNAKQAIADAEDAIEDCRGSDKDIEKDSAKLRSAERILDRARKELKKCKGKRAESTAKQAKRIAEQACTEKECSIEQKTPEEKDKKKKKTQEELEELSLKLKDVHFNYDQAQITLAAKSVLKENARTISELLQDDSYMIVFIEGHCDERGTNEYNIALGQKRADAVMTYLVGYGIDAERLNTISYGEFEPVDLGHNEDAWAKNRRAHFALKYKE